MPADLHGKTIVITGGSSGIGAAAARILTTMGARLVITGRSAATETLASSIGCDFYLVDYTRFADVRRFAETLRATYPRIDVLVNNVGGIIGDRRTTADGHETTFQINHLSGFLLTSLLQERLEQSEATVINTSSVANTVGRIDLNDLENRNNYKPIRAYGTGKLMNILHAMEITRRFSGVNGVSFHPGGVATGFAREGRGLVKWLYAAPLKRLYLMSPEKGADTLVWLASTRPGTDWTPGGYYHRRKPGRKNRQASEPGLPQALWDASDELISAS
jgi:NAD(P)-dependent dehydrogenase (short-subunit alcohol dehydrogenase family)